MSSLFDAWAGKAASRLGDPVSIANAAWKPADFGVLALAKPSRADQVGALASWVVPRPWLRPAIRQSSVGLGQPETRPRTTKRVSASKWWRTRRIGLDLLDGDSDNLMVDLLDLPAIGV